MEAFSFGSYYPGEGPLYRLDPRTKLMGGIAFLIIALMARSAIALMPLGLFVAALYLLAGVPAGRAVRSLVPLLGIIVVVGVLNLFTDHSGSVLVNWGILQISEGSLGSFAFISARMLAMMCAMSIVTMTTQTLDLTHAVERLLAPLSRFGGERRRLPVVAGFSIFL